MAVNELPDVDSPDIRLVVATPEEELAQRHGNSVEWAGALSIEGYLRREDILANQTLTKHGGLTTWILVYQPPDGSQRQVLCGCETILKKVLVAKDGQVQDATAQGVCSVFSPPKHRGKGYAGRMMAELGERLKDWQAVDGKSNAFSVLYSDIGKTFYKSRGWHPFPSAHVSLLPTNASSQRLPPVRILESKDLAELCKLDELLLRKRLSKHHQSGRKAVALIPDIATLEWHYAREDFFSHEIYGRSPKVRGAIVGDQVGSRVWCYWNRVWKNPQEHAPTTLHILRLVIEDDSFSDLGPAEESKVSKLIQDSTTHKVAALFAAAQDQLREWDMHEVEIWNPTTMTLAATRLLDPKSVIEHREKQSITSLQWYGDGGWEDVDWVCNEKYAWC